MLRSGSRKPKILFVITEDWYFWSHRLELARGARDAGFEVCVATRVASHRKRIRREGFKLVNIGLRRESRNPFSELEAILELIRVFRAEKPDVIHLVAMKPILYGSLASFSVPQASVISAIAGMGFLGTSSQPLTRAIRSAIDLLFRIIFNRKRAWVIVQNSDDSRELQKIIRDRGRLVILRGVGVDLNQFRAVPEHDGTPVVVLPARMLWNKGIQEFVHAANAIRERNINARFVLVGGTDEASPAGIKTQQLRQWTASGVVEWHGHCDNMPRVLQAANMVCLPSYREGVPKALIEAAASGRAIVTTDVPGCREIVRHGKNGLLVQARDSKALSDALQLLIENPTLRKQMGDCGRKFAEQEFSVEDNVEKTVSLYRQILNDRTCQPA